MTVAHQSELIPGFPLGCVVYRSFVMDWKSNYTVGVFLSQLFRTIIQSDGQPVLDEQEWIYWYHMGSYRKIPRVVHSIGWCCIELKHNSEWTAFRSNILELILEGSQQAHPDVWHNRSPPWRPRLWKISIACTISLAFLKWSSSESKRIHSEILPTISFLHMLFSNIVSGPRDQKHEHSSIGCFFQSNNIRICIKYLW